MNAVIVTVVAAVILLALLTYIAHLHDTVQRQADAHSRARAEAAHYARQAAAARAELEKLQREIKFPTQ